MFESHIQNVENTFLCCVTGFIQVFANELITLCYEMFLNLLVFMCAGQAQFFAKPTSRSPVPFRL